MGWWTSVPTPNLAPLAELIRTRNAVGKETAALIGRPAHTGHVGEYIATAALEFCPALGYNTRRRFR